MKRVDPIRWQRIDAALREVLAVPARDRDAVLHRICTGDVELRRELDSLLAAAAASGDFLETSAASFAAAHLIDPTVDARPPDGPDMVVGRYRLVEEIGRGGMGTVWLAERADGQFEQRVALKLIKRGMDSDEILTRFLRERQILARLEHSHIARLLDGGVSEDGRPYFVMEHVAGEPITQYAEARRLPVEVRLRLFAEVCQAVQYAHRNLIVHRDLKPSNVLVTEAGNVKLLDFGVAKLLEAGGDPATLPPAGGHFLTPQYASPEQLTGDVITTASDVYQLGVLLFELLAGERPYRGRTSQELRRAILDTEPRRPSVIGAGPFPRRLHGDLDTIVLAALRKHPGRRYSSAEALGDDIERHLARRPIRMSADRFGYRAARFVSRNRGRVGVAALVLFIAATAAGYYTVRVRQERDTARAEAAKAGESAELMRQLFGSWDPDAADRGEIQASAILGNARRRAETELAGRPALLAASLSLLGELYFALGERIRADSLLGQAQTIQEALPSGGNTDLAATLTRRSRVYWMQRKPELAVRTLRRAVAFYGVGSLPDNLETLRARMELARMLVDSNDLDESERLLREVSLALGEGGRDSPFGLETAAQLGYALFRQGRNDEAVALLRPTLERQRRIFGERYAPAVETARYLASALRDQGQLVEAESLYREVLRTTRVLYGEDHEATATTMKVLSMLLERTGELEEAEQLTRRTIAIFGPQHDQIAMELVRLGGIRLDRGDPAEAERWLREGLTALRRMFRGGHPDEGDALNRLAYILVERGSADAPRMYDEALGFDRIQPAGAARFVTDGLHFLAWAQHRQGDVAGAEATYRKALTLYRAQLPPNHPYTLFTLRGLAALGKGETVSH